VDGLSGEGFLGVEEDLVRGFAIACGLCCGCNCGFVIGRVCLGGGVSLIGGDRLGGGVSVIGRVGLDNCFSGGVGMDSEAGIALVGAADNKSGSIVSPYGKFGRR
jgi:hypothetical protein